MDNNLTDQLLSLQAKAVELGLLAQKFEDEGNAYYALTQTGVSDNLPTFIGIMLFKENHLMAFFKLKHIF